MISASLTLLLSGACALTLAVGGCGLLGGGKDTNKLTVDHRCQVELDQMGKVTGLDETTLIESVTIEPDCSVTITVTDEVSPPLRKHEKEQEEIEAT